MCAVNQTHMYAIRLRPGTYHPPMAAGMYVAHSALPSETRFTPDIQTARTWGSYPEAYSYLDDNLYGMAEVVRVASINRLLADINSSGVNQATEGFSQLAEDKLDKKPTSQEWPLGEAKSSSHYQQPQPTTHENRPLPQESTLISSGDSLPELDDTLYLYHLYHKSQLFELQVQPLAEEWATVAEMSLNNLDAIQQGFIWAKVQE